MKRLLFVLIGSVLLAAPMTAPSVAPVSAYSNNYHFDYTLAPWLPGSDFGTFDKGTLMRESGKGSPICSFDGNGYASLIGLKNQSTWMVTSVEAQDLNIIELRWNAIYSQQSSVWCSNGCDAIAYIGESMPIESSEFNTVSKLTDAWRDYRYTQSVRANGTVYIAVGWRSHNIGLSDLALEPDKSTAVVVDVDCLGVTINPIGK